MSDLLAIKREALSSISLTKNTKGYSWDVKVYFDQEVHSEMEVAQVKIMALDTWLRKTYGGQE